MAFRQYDPRDSIIEALLRQQAALTQEPIPFGLDRYVRHIYSTHPTRDQRQPEPELPPEPTSAPPPEPPVNAPLEAPAGQLMGGMDPQTWYRMYTGRR